MKNIEQLAQRGGGPVESESLTPDYFEKMYRRTSEMGRIGVWECDLATEELTWTDMVYDIFGFPRQSVLSRAATLACYEPNCRRELELRRAQAIANCSSFTVDVAIRTLQGDHRWVRITGDVEQEDGKANRIFGTKQDITGEKTAQLELQSLQAGLVHLSHESAVNAMGSTLAHELNQPLAAIASYAAALRAGIGRGAGSSAQEVEVLAGIEECSIKAGMILRELYKSFARGEKSTGFFHVESEIRLACRVALSGAHGEPNVVYALSEGLSAKGDPAQFRLVVINLIRNAQEAMTGSPDQEILISTAEFDGFVEVSVRDSGQGIAGGEIHSLFDAFVSTKPGRSGLGLAISRTIVESFTGKLCAENNAAGGATFRFSIPAA